MTQFLDPDKAAELLINGTVGNVGPRLDLVFEPDRGPGFRSRMMVAAGDGNTEEALGQASLLRHRLIKAVAGVLREFGETRSQTRNAA